MNVRGTAPLLVKGIPDSVSDDVSAVCHSRLHRAISDLMNESGLTSVWVSVGTDEKLEHNYRNSDTGYAEPDELSLEARAKQYVPSEPLWKIDQLVVSEELSEEICNAIEILNLEALVFDEWGLREFEPFPRSVLNFYGPPGTGKTLAAHAIASSLNRKILITSYAQIESKYHGEGPKNVEALFYAAQRENAILFIDEADSLLSRRLLNVTQGSEQAINSMRSQLLICLEKHCGVVIFATNLVENYDNAFETRVRHLHFPLPDVRLREEIWRKHLPKNLPLAQDVDTQTLAEGSEGLCGRDIKNAVINCALSVARSGRKLVTSIDLTRSISAINNSKKAMKGGIPTEEVTPEEKQHLESKLKQAFKCNPS